MNRQSIHQFICCFLLITPLTIFSAEVSRDLSGTWILNIELSDDFQEKIKEHVKSARNNRGKPDGYSGASEKGNSRGKPDGYSGASGKGNSRGSGRHPSQDIQQNKKAIQRELANFMLFTDKIQISQNDPEIIMTLSEIKQRFIYTDGRGITVTSNSSTSNPVRPYIAEWETNNQLIIETATRIGQVEEYFFLSQNKKQLHTKIVLTLPTSDDPVTVNRIYDLVAE